MPDHIPRLNRDQLFFQFAKLDKVVGLTPAQKRTLREMLLARANPDNDKIQTILKTLPKSRQDEILRIFEEVARMQQAQADQGGNAVLLLGILTLGSLILSYLLTADQLALTAAQLFEVNKRTWINAIQDEIDYCGCNARARAASGADLDRLRQMAEEDALSIVGTYNKDSQHQLEKLFEANPNASKQFFIESMKAWAEKRSAWKSIQIAATTEFNAREFARRRFAQENYALDSQYKFVGPPTVCEICLREFAAGFVSYQHTLDAPCPRHTGCPHQWRLKRKPKVDCQNLWVG